jgi:hypothetical protein|tara:strand:+ start:1095 stop:1376 length:282 start_codon:yes stop_codon:yes gene_type:complete
MKISKERLKQIIKEEVEKTNKDQEQEASPENKQEMAKKFKELYTLIPRLSGLDKTEIVLLNKLITSAIKLSSEGSAKTGLLRALKMLGVDVNE